MPSLALREGPYSSVSDSLGFGAEDFAKRPEGSDSRFVTGAGQAGF